MQVVEHFGDYEIISMSNGEKKERWGKYYLLRPDPEIIWKEKIEYNDISAHYHRSNKGGGYWEKQKNLPDSWQVNYKDLKFNVKLKILPQKSFDFCYHTLNYLKFKTGAFVCLHLTLR